MTIGSWSTRSCSADSVVDALLVRAPPQPPPQRRPRVAAEVVGVPAVDGLEEEVDLDALGVLGYRYSHTRIRDRSCSTSTGLVM